MWVQFHLREHIKTILAIFLTCFGTYLLFWSGHHYSLDGIVMFEYAKSLLFQRSFIMEPPVVWDKVYPISIWPIGQTIFYIPVLAIFSVTIFRSDPAIQQIPFKSGDPYFLKLMDNQAYKFASLSMPVITAISAVLVFVLAIQFGLSKRKAAAAALIFGIASPAAVYARFDFAQPLASLLLLLAIVLAVQYSQIKYWSPLLSGFFMGLAFLTRPETIFIAGPALIGITVINPTIDRQTDRQTDRLRSIYALSLMIGLIGLFILINQYINAMRFGHFLDFGYQEASGNFFVFDSARIGIALAGNLASPGRGLFIFFPISLLSLWGFHRLWKQSRLKSSLLVSFPLGALLLYSAWSEWAAGISWGPRFLIPVLPYFTVLAMWGVELPERIPAWLRKALVGGLILAGWIISLQGQLFNYLGFYAAKKLTDAEIIIGNYNFDWQYSPIVTGWQWGFAQSSVDIYWYSGLVNGSMRTVVIVSVLLLILAGSGIFWLNYLSKNSRGGGSLD